MTPPPLRLHLALLFVQVTFGAFHVFGKAILAHFDPLVVAGLRVSVAAPVLILLAAAVDRHLPPLRVLPSLALLGLFGVCLNQLLYILGLHLTQATHAGILMPSIPVFAVALTMAMGIERFSGLRTSGVGLAVVGALVMLRSGEPTALHIGTSGDLLVLLNCLSYSLFLVLAKPVLRDLSALTVIAFTYLFGGLGVLAAAAPSMISFDYSRVPPFAWAGLAYIIAIPSILGYLLNTWAVKRSSPTLVAAYITLQPAAAAALAALILGESFGAREITGFLLICGGLVMVSAVQDSGGR